MAEDLSDADIAMDSANLYREETFTDRRVGTLQVLTPITKTGATDSARPVLYVGQTQVLTPAGALPLSFEVPAKSLDDAVAQFGEHAKRLSSERCAGSRSCAASRRLRSSCRAPARCRREASAARGGGRFVR